MGQGNFRDWLPLRGRWLRYWWYSVPVVLLVWINVYRESELRDSARQAGRVGAARTQLGNFKTAIELYRADHDGNPPSTATGLEALIHPPRFGADASRWKGPYLYDVSTVPHDPWGHPLVYQSPGSEGEPFEIISYGADGKPGGEWFNEDLSTTKR